MSILSLSHIRRMFDGVARYNGVLKCFPLNLHLATLQLLFSLQSVRWRMSDLHL